MTLAEPALLALLLLIPLLALGAFFAERQRRTAWQKLVAPRLRKKLAAPLSPLSRWLSLGCGLLGLALLVICLAQPIAGEVENTSLVKGRNIIIAVDASRSMLVRDVAPDRLNAAKTAVYELLERFPNDRIGLLAFAGSASLQAPLTTDHNALRETLEQLNETNVPSGGSNLADAINLATRTFKETGQKTHGLIVISDGELHEGALEDASFDARQAGVFVVTIGVGTREGDFVPDPTESDERFRDRNGKAVLSRLNPEPLRTLAGDTGGLYLEGLGANFTDQIDTVISRLDAFEDEGRIQTTPLPRFQLFLLPAMVFMLASLLLRFLWSPAKPRAVTASPATLALITIALFASTSDGDAWNNPLEGFLGSRALKKGEHEKAIEHFEKAAAATANPEELAKLRYGQGAARYQGGNYSAAGEAFSQALLSTDKDLQRDAHHQLANSLFHRASEKQAEGNSAEENQADGKTGLEQPIAYLEDALEHYDSALEIDQKHSPSLQNRKVAEELLEQLKKAQQEQEQEQQEQEQEESEEGENEEEQDGEGEEGEEGEPGENGEQQEGQNEQDPQEGEDGEEESEEEGQQGEDEGEEGNEGEQQQEEPGQEEGEQEDQEGSSQQQGQQGPAPREDETSEEFARRILEENADFQKDALRKHGQQIVPTKDW